MQVAVVVLDKHGALLIYESWSLEGLQETWKWTPPVSGGEWSFREGHCPLPCVFQEGHVSFCDRFCSGWSWVFSDFHLAIVLQLWAPHRSSRSFQWLGEREETGPARSSVCLRELLVCDGELPGRSNDG